MQLFEAEIDSRAKGSFPHCLFVGIVLVIGAVILFYNLANKYHPITYETIKIWFYFLIGVGILELIILKVLLPDDKIRLIRSGEKIVLQIIHDGNVSNSLEVKQIRYWWNYANYGDNEREDYGSPDSSLSGVGSLNNLGLYVKVMYKENDFIILYETDRLWDGNPKWNYQLEKPEANNMIKCFYLEKFVQVLEMNNIN